MFVLFKEIEFSSAHIIPGHPGLCKNIHGHTYKLKVYVESQKLNELQMVMDFADLNKILKEAIRDFDHNYLNNLMEFKDKIPTAENIAYILFYRIKDMLPQFLKLQKVEVYENDSSCAIYYP